ncbi:uncharacterized protein BJ171DRAFT_84467 [Polychytrium aggregatum]|uniref:uncharacterized protein n=1 Tax=Polychytrium aggregatum TaxID=110093 RepID=UPI0022FF44D6|nr:uncharacterized protein BJ171DRAFT_84467 [Polychytrium aggregatum]KAI9205184.1 hypothetical protein BJ171DRAFT_84467 [Polychytrium aggregatum]
MSSALRFDNRVVVITGAGGGLGKVYALFFASRGASVVVNDLGQAADAVVAEITKAGGKAIADHHSVEDGDKIVQAALAAFGRIDIVINNAGILRDKSFSRMSDAEWDSVHAVHVRGSYKVTKAAWDHFVKQKYGRVINTASAAGIYGNFGQANYSSAKLALHGFTMTLAREGARNNIHVNTIAPLAASRMTETVMPPEILNSLKPEYIVPLVAYLCHESTAENGGIFELGAGFVSKLRRERSRGVVFKADSSFTPGAVAARWKEICDFNQPEYPNSITDTDWMSLLDKAKHLQTNAQSASDLRFDDRVVLVTGAGAGLGRAYSLLFGKLGASVVVNDLGAPAAEKVAQEIRAAGGKAMVVAGSVENGEQIVQAVIDAFGRIDVVVNNAGILRDRSFARMTDNEWDLVYNIHLRGTYKVTRAAWGHMLKQKYGRIINTCSAVGLYGNFGQANYSAAKAGILALTNTLALEGQKHNIICNTIAPNAGTAMTATILPPEVVEALKPDYVAPLVAFLAHESNTETRGCYEVGSGWISKVRWQRSGGVGFPVDGQLLPEHIASNWNAITTFDDGRAHWPATTQESFTAIQANFGHTSGAAAPARAPKDGASKVDVAKAQSIKFPSQTFSYSQRDVIIYALGVGARRTDLPLVYENSDKFVALPTYGVVPAFAAQSAVSFGDFMPNFNPMMLLHGEQYLEFKKPLPVAGNVVNQARVIDILDKGSGAALILGVTTTDEKGEVICENQFTHFIRGSGGFGGKKESQRGPATEANEAPSRPADAVMREKTTPDQAALYRQSGDLNPLHIDPQMSAMGGFDVPILHGLCSFGIAGKHIFQKYGNGNPASFKSIKARFVKHVFPGETLETHMWKEGNKVIFQVKVVERNVVVISNAAVILNDVPVPSKVTAPATAGAATIFAQIESGLNSLSAEERKTQVSKTKAIFGFDITDASGALSNWFIDLKQGDGAVGSGKQAPNNAKIDMTVSVSDKDFVDLAAGKANPQKLFMAGKLKVKGNMGLATKLEGVLKLGAGGKAKL